MVTVQDPTAPGANAPASAHGVSRLETSQWLGTLSREKRQAIRALHDLRPVWNWVVVLYPAVWLGVAWILCKIPSWPVLIAGYIVIGTCIHAMAVLVHEGSHYSIFRSRILDRWVGFLMGVPVLVSFSAYRTLHGFHHRYTRDVGDPDEFLHVTENRTALEVLFYSWLVFGTPIYLIHVAVTALKLGKPRERFEVITEYVLLAMICAGVAFLCQRFDGWSILLHCWALPMIIAMLFGNIRSWAEHQMTQPGHPLTQTRTVVSNRVVSFLMCNLNYHLEHHLCPGIPWYNLPKLHDMLQDEYRQAGSFVYRSYFRFLWDAFRVGVFGIAREFQTA
jgi:fatty acid desaturase